MFVNGYITGGLILCLLVLAAIVIKKIRRNRTFKNTLYLNNGKTVKCIILDKDADGTIKIQTTDYTERIYLPAEVIKVN